MPGRRQVKKGSFGGHFDELVKHFPEDKTGRTNAPGKPKLDPKDVHDRLFEGAWRAAREGPQLRR